MPRISDKELHRIGFEAWNEQKANCKDVQQIIDALRECYAALEPFAQCWKERNKARCLSIVAENYTAFEGAAEAVREKGTSDDGKE